MNENQDGGDLVPERFQHVPDDDGLSLEELSEAYAQLLSRGATPYDEPEVDCAPQEHSMPDPVQESSAADVSCDLTPKSILEAMLFVGNGDNRPLTSRRVASLMRGVPPDEIDDLVRELNSDYLREGRPYSIVSVGPGYRMQLRGEYAWMRDRYYGRVKEARLSQPAIDVLAIVAYRQPVSREDIDRIRSKPSGGMLAQLLRRGLLQLDRAGAAGGAFQYRTTDRFLQLFGLASLADLPQSQELPSDEGTF